MNKRTNIYLGLDVMVYVIKLNDGTYLFINAKPEYEFQQYIYEKQM